FRGLVLVFPGSLYRARPRADALRKRPSACLRALYQANFCVPGARLCPGFGLDTQLARGVATGTLDCLPWIRDPAFAARCHDLEVRDDERQFGVWCRCHSAEPFFA